MSHPQLILMHTQHWAIHYISNLSPVYFESKGRKGRRGGEGGGGGGGKGKVCFSPPPLGLA